MAHSPVGALDASTVRAWAAASLVELAAARDEIDALNVYPVPDGDTGTNLYLTLQAALAADADLDDDADPGVVLAALARGAFLGARGNSGMILSQVLRGLADSLGSRPADAAALAKGLERAADAAYAAVAEPVEGTMLTVLRCAALAADSTTGGAAADTTTAGGSASLAALTTASAAAARAALARTPEQLDVLRDAGVVDAGGRGICVLLDVLERVVSGGSPAAASPAAGAPAAPTPAGEATPASVPRASAASGAGTAAQAPSVPAYEVMFLLEAPEDAMPGLRQALVQIGDSVAIARDAVAWNVHVHVDDVRGALRAALAAGQPSAVRVTALREVDASGRPGSMSRAVVAVADDDAVGTLFQRAGAVVVGEGAAQVDVLAECYAAGVHELIVLPTDERTRDVARAAADQARGAGLQVEVIPSRAAVQALAALSVHDGTNAFRDDVSQMTAAAGGCRHGAVRRADGHAVAGAAETGRGELVGVADDEVVAVGSSASEVACAVVDQLLADGGEAVTLVTGADSADGLAELVAAHVRRERPHVEIVVYHAQHPAVLLIGVE